MSATTPEIEVGASLKQETEPKIVGYHDVKDAYEAELKDEDQENMVGVFLSSSNHVLGDALLFRGGHRSVSVEPREIVRKALEFNAAAVIVLHNHPCGNSEPTRADIDATKEIKERLDTFDMNLLDHVIVSPHGCTSMRRDGSFPEESDVEGGAP